MRNVVLLAALPQLSMVTTFLLPGDVAWQVVTTVWPIVVPFKFVCVLALTVLLKREWAMSDEAKRLCLEASHDPLTGLLNRHGFEAAVAHASAKEPGSAILVLDLDHFKRVNDTYEHDAGEVVLKEVASRLTHALRLGDVVARFGGEEMVVFLPSLTARTAIDVAAWLCQVVRNHPVTLSIGKDVALTASVGVAWTGAMIGPVKPEELLGQADAALYAAKEAGRDCWRFNMGGRVTASHAAAPRVTLSLVA